MKETELVRLCIAYLSLRDHYVWRNNTVVTRSCYTNKAGIRSDRMWRAGMKGSSDILGVTKDGKFLAVECKIGKNKPTPIQEEFLLSIRGRGGIAIVAYDITDLEKAGL